MKPRISKKGKVAQLSYNLPHRIHTTQTYPVTAPNGSTIILYGHGGGVKLLWRGGRPLKQRQEAPKSKPQPNGVKPKDDAIMIIDSDDDELAPAPRHAEEPIEEAEHESEEEEYDPFEPYLPIAQTLDLALGAEVLRIAVPAVPSSSSLRSTSSFPAILKQKIVFAVACTDCSVRLITLPLAPPSASRATRQLPAGQARWSEEVLTLPSHAGHQSIPTDVSLAWTPRNTTQFAGFNAQADDKSDDDDDEDTQHANMLEEPKDWDFLLASTSNEINGLLRINRIEISSQNKLSLAPQTPYQTLYLPSPASAIAFNTSLYPARRHSDLLIADPKGLIRIYSPLSPSRTRPRSSRPSTPNEPPRLGIWSAAFSTPFSSTKGSSPTIAKRKHILASSWASYGRAVMVLLQDGEWGIWSLEDTDQTRSRVHPSGAGAMAFVIRGFIGTASTSGPNQESDRKRGSKLAPMTPNTRKTKQENLFSGAFGSSSGPARGGISIAAKDSDRGQGEESVLIWYNNEVYTMPSLQAFWNRASGGGGSLYGPGISRIEDLDFFNERISNTQYLSSISLNSKPELLITAETRLIIQSTGQRPDVERAMNLFRKEEDAMRIDGADVEKSVDLKMLAEGQLDLGGMDRLLDTMDGSGDVAMAEGPAPVGRRVGFAAGL